jgi:hypothetical protein
MDPSTFTDPQAQATIEAARIGAAAAIHAAWIQATAAAGAVAAGALAYIGAVRQVRFQERTQKVRALAYRFRLTRVVEEYYEQVVRACAAAQAQLAAFRSGKASVAITSFRLVQPRMLHDENWEAHAMLGRWAVELILLIDDLSQRLAKFDQEIRGEGTRTDSSFARGSLRERDVTEAGQPAYAPEHAIVDYAEVLDRLRAALAALIRELAEPEPTLPWRKLRLPGRRHAHRMTPAPRARTRPTHGDGDPSAAPCTPSAAPVRRADRSALRPNSVRTHEPVAGENGFPDLGQRKAPDQREVEAPVPSRCAGRASAGSSTCRRCTRRKLDGPYRWGPRRHSRGVDPGDRGGRRARRRTLAFIGAVRLARGGLAFSPCRAMGVWR